MCGHDLTHRVEIVWRARIGFVPGELGQLAIKPDGRLGAFWKSQGNLAFELLRVFAHCNLGAIRQPNNVGW